MMMDDLGYDSFVDSMMARLRRTDLEQSSTSCFVAIKQRRNRRNAIVVSTVDNVILWNDENATEPESHTENKNENPSMSFQS